MEESFDRDFWERRWDQVVREHPDAVANRPPSEHVAQERRRAAEGSGVDAVIRAVAAEWGAPQAVASPAFHTT